MSPLEQLRERVKRREFTLAVVGIGRVGLPLALAFANAGVRTFGVDVNPEYVAKLARKEVPFREAGMEEYIGSSNFTPTVDEKALKESDIVVLTIGTPLTEQMKPDYAQLRAVMEKLVRLDLHGKLIITRSTTGPETMLNFTKPTLEKASGLKAGVDFGLAVCPERILEGKAFEELAGLPEIVGGVDALSSEIAASFFRVLNPEKRILFVSPTAAELAKLFTNVYRYVNFALANEFGLIAEEYGEDAHAVIEALNDGYKRGGVPRPGPAGGPCLSKDGYYLTSNMTFPDFILMAWRLNEEAVPRHMVNAVKKRLKARGKTMHEARVAVLGAAFKAGSDDVRYSPAVRIAELLKAEGAEVRVHDPYVQGTLELAQAADSADAVVLAVNHPEFAGVAAKLPRGSVLVDCWGFIEPAEAKAAGLEYVRFGSGKA
ncbi:MAG TPA: nucleotide sugar dehydrogenase [archaeon]|nr:nucleotide sugar dehydrogenase [archaeon]